MSRLAKRLLNELANAPANGLAQGLAMTLALGLAACGSPPPAPPGPVAVPRPAPAAAASAPSRTDGVEAFERQQRERAEIAQRQGRLADAALAWEVLTALKPQRSDYRERLAATLSQIRAVVEDRLGKAAAAQKRGEFDGAVQHYLAVLALEPSHEAAADALRAIERERQKRHVGRLARDPLHRRSNGEVDPRTQAPPATTRSLARPAAASAAKAVRPPSSAASDPR
jgi:tetratricopeptide (TPR) repeat protein